MQGFYFLWGGSELSFVIVIWESELRKIFGISGMFYKRVLVNEGFSSKLTGRSRGFPDGKKKSAFLAKKEILKSFSL